MSFFKTKTGIVFIGFAVIAGYQLIVEHGVHLAPYLPWLILLACPLMHLFMHHGHGDHNHRHDKTEPKVDDRSQNLPAEQGGYHDGNKQ